MSSSTSLNSSMSEPVIYRSPSNSSVASASSRSSLARRPTIRAPSRSKAIAGSTQRSSRPDIQRLDNHSYTPQEHLQPLEPNMLDTQDLHAKASGSLQGSMDSGALDVTIVADVQSPMAVKTPKGEPTSSLPNIPTVPSQPPSSFLYDAPLTPVANMRDSVSTQKSGASSSVYPLSVSSEPESPTPNRSIHPAMSEDIEHFEISQDDIPGFDPDDVSYRLRLLVKNNYFLPPAHSKPVMSDLSPPDPKKSTRAATPTFLDIFRVHKLRSKPNSPVGSGHDSGFPILRATGDSITSPHASQPRPSTQIPRLGSPNPMPLERMGRVVVVREKMPDLTVAAKHAEQEIKSRGVRRDIEPLVIHVLEDVIDPTDAVDIPPPSPSYPFPMQTSAFHGLGVSESIGAAVLAERLPPGSPGLSSVDPAEDDWRKSLLQAAVHHSLENTADLSSFSQVIDVSTPVDSPKEKESLPAQYGQATATPNPRILLGKRILEQPFPHSSESFRNEDENEAGEAASIKSLDTQEHLSVGSSAVSRPASYLPARVATPTDPLTALTPPPPRKQSVPFVSQSQTDLPAGTTVIPPPERQSRTPTPTLRKAMSSPMLSDSYEPDARRANRITPPPLPATNVLSRDSSHEQAMSNDASRELERSQSIATDSVYSEDEYIIRPGRVSAALSALMSRTSLSNYSQESFSPTTSAFQHDLNNAYVYGPPDPSSQESHQVASSCDDCPVPRGSTISPPPRISSSLAHVALPPPPRRSSLWHPPLSGEAASSRMQQQSMDSVVRFAVAEPTTPPPLSERRGNPSGAPLTLQVPTGDNIEAALHSAPTPSSPTSFFDSIQAQPNALDDLDSSSDESDVGNSSYADARSRTMSNVSSPNKSPLMRLGNHSTPHISRTARSAADHRAPMPFGVRDRKQPIANVPQPKPFFVQQRSGKSDQGQSTPVSSFDFYKYTREHVRDPSTDVTGPQRPDAAGSSRSKPTRSATADESLRRLDGLLQQHMVAEKDTIRRIAKTLQSSNKPRTQLQEFKP